MAIRYELTPSRALGSLLPALLVIGAGVLGALAFVVALVAAVVGGSPAKAVAGGYVAPSGPHACTWDGSKTGAINPAITSANTPGFAQVIGPDGVPMVTRSGAAVLHPKWKLLRYGHAVTKGAYGPHSSDFRGMLEQVYGYATEEQTYDAYCHQDMALQITSSALGLGRGTPLNPSFRQDRWSDVVWEVSTLEAVPRAARLRRQGGADEILEIERQLEAIRAGLIPAWKQDGYGAWRPIRKPSALDMLLSYRPGRLSTPWVGTDLVRQ